MKYRGKTEITTMILRAAKRGALKTRIMYKAYLSFNQVQEYLPYLQDNGLINCEEGSKVYRTTEKGSKLLRSYEEINELVTPSNGRMMRKPIIIKVQKGSKTKGFNPFPPKPSEEIRLPKVEPSSSEI